FVEIPDLYLRRAIQHTLKLGFDDPVTEADMRRLTRLHAVHMQIINLSGLEHAVNLTSLRLNRNWIVDISPLKDLIRLRELDLSECLNIESLNPLANLANLSELSLWDCRLEDISGLANLTGLTKLNLRLNRIEDIAPLRGMVRLEVLNLSFNSFSDISPLEGMTELTELRLSNNFIEDLSALANLTRLTELYLNGCGTVDIRPLANLGNLTVLAADSNWIEEIGALSNLQNLTKLDLSGNRLTDIGPLANLAQLTALELNGCRLRDISALANLANLTYLELNNNQIDDVRPLASLAQLTELELSTNRIVDVRPLANLAQLTKLALERNRIEDVSPLANLSNLKELYIRYNPILDHSPLDGLSLRRFFYTESCAVPRLPIADRINNRDYPSIILPIPDVIRYSPNAKLARHDLGYGPRGFRLHFAFGPTTVTVGGDIDGALYERKKTQSINPDFLYLISVPSGVSTTGNFLRPPVENVQFQRALAVYRCGVYDGIMFNDERDKVQGTRGDRADEALATAREHYLRHIRAETGDEFLILVGAGWRNVPGIGDYVNGIFLELKVDRWDDPHDDRIITRALIEVENHLIWADRNLKAPQINCLEVWSIPGEYLLSEKNSRLMRATTALNLTHSDGYFKYGTGVLGRSVKLWYEFWDANLGGPIGDKARPYDDQPGLFIREFTNGWAVYNRSGETRLLRLPEEVRGASSGVQGTEHELSNLDGEIYIRINPRNPADLNNDGEVNILDLTLVAQGFGTDDSTADVNGDGVVNIFDLVLVVNQVQNNN
ncbi:MAG: leucine-rich repeat domain-containing protein, partial [Candidatus Poribacteria bacterium]|nr:leucine-rich repeat domain-containing protein [Candidatus Poribacteria bacterium]